MQQPENSLWSATHAAAYESENYGHGPAGYVMRKSHSLIEREFGPSRHFDTVLEVGAGSGIHLRYVRHSFDRYFITDSSTAMLEEIAQRRTGFTGGKVIVRKEDATNLTFPDNSVARLIATHVLEHLPQPHLVIEEWLRVLMPGGLLSVVLPCDPGAIWRLGRHFGPRARGRKRGLNYDYVMALEHINPINNLLAIIRHHAPNRHELWWPCLVPSTDLNLIFAVNITK